MAHDLRSPLRSIHSFTSLTLRSFADRLPVEAQDYLRRASDAALRLAKMIDALLDLSRLTRRPLDRRPLDLTALARRLFEETGPDRAGRTVDFSAHEGLEARADEKLVEAILRNLIGNAVKFTRDSSPARIEVGRSDDGWFYVKDNGVGFDDAYAGKIFEPFQRLHPNAGFPGTGIGLAVVQRATARHGGRVRATAAPGRGATFWFTLEPAPVKG